MTFKTLLVAEKREFKVHRVFYFYLVKVLMAYRTWTNFCET